MENYEEERDVISFEENKSEEKEISFEESLEELENKIGWSQVMFHWMMQSANSIGQ